MNCIIDFRAPAKKVNFAKPFEHIKRCGRVKNKKNKTKKQIDDHPLTPIYRL